ncbi:hypothetical protein ANO11243_078620 [Dothideomycetidae sp. 11243]|nr:hypothetical protein ANO11243_078620 [fungal sp. No.11243]
MAGHRKTAAPASPKPLTHANRAIISPILLYIATGALHGALSQLMLSPVYGSIVSSEYHDKVTLTACLLGSVFSMFSSSMDAPLLRLRVWISVLPFYFPVVSAFLFPYSQDLGSNWGPLTTEVLTLGPFHFTFSAYIGALLSADYRVFKNQRILHFAVVFAISQIIMRLEPFLLESLPNLALQSTYLTRLWLSLAVSTTGLTQTSVLGALAAIPAISHTLQRNPHLEWRPIRALPALEQAGYSLIDRKESITGYISVLENNELSYRVLRCDHSLLGGEWLLTDSAISRGITGTEPVYAVFEMLEAVRLVDSAKKPRDKDSTALVIGLGIGTAPKALLAHGIDTTIVELDPVVHEFATKYFDLPTNHSSYLEDAVGWTRSRVSRGVTPYDYILHDVFTGGAEPLALFTESFITNLRTLLKPEGVIAINYAGSVISQPAKQVLNTINIVFEGRCRIFRDLVPEEDDDDFSNMVIFCLNPAASNKHQKPVFRKPVEADFLSSVSRRTQLVPNPKLEITFPSKEEMEVEAVQTLTEANMGSFSRQQMSNAKKHWEVMRQVVYPSVWEMW